jgi:hypothetical protein
MSICTGVSNSTQLSRGHLQTFPELKKNNAEIQQAEAVAGGNSPVNSYF